MRKLLLLCVAGIIGVFTTGCEPPTMPDKLVDAAGVSYYVWENQSDHRISISLNATHPVSDWAHDTPAGFSEEILEPQERLERIDIGSGSVPPPGVGWTMTLRFDDGTYNVVYGWNANKDQPYEQPESYDEQYDPTLMQNYTIENVESPFDCKECAGRRWTYTFTNADYDAAVARGAIETGEESTGE